MRTSNGHRTALTAMLLGAAVIAGAGAASRDLLLERWWLWKLDSKDLPVRLKAAERLGAMGSRASIPKLIDLLKDTDSRLTVNSGGAAISSADFVAGILEGLGPPAIPALAQALKDTPGEKNYWRRSACRAMGRIGSPEAIAPLVGCLDDGFGCVQMQAFYCLGSLGHRAEAAIPAIGGHLQDPKRDVRGWAEESLKRIRVDRRIPCRE